MTREEFEAVIAIEGKYLEVRPTITKKRVTWNAVVWRWFDPVSELTSPQARHYLKAMGLDVGRHKREIAESYGEPTNHKAVQLLIRNWEKGYF